MADMKRSDLIKKLGERSYRKIRSAETKQKDKISLWANDKTAIVLLETKNGGFNLYSKMETEEL